MLAVLLEDLVQQPAVLALLRVEELSRDVYDS